MISDRIFADRGELHTHFGGFAVRFCDTLYHLGVGESFVIHDSGFARHRKIFNGQSDDRAFADFLVASAFFFFLYAYVLFDEVADGGDTVNLDYHVEVVDGFAYGFERGDEFFASG